MFLKTRWSCSSARGSQQCVAVCTFRTVSYISHRPSKSIVLSTVNIIHFHGNKLGEHATTVSTTPQLHRSSRCRLFSIAPAQKRRRRGMSLEPPEEDAEDTALLGRTTFTWTRKGWTAWILVMWLAASLTWIWFRQGPNKAEGRYTGSLASKLLYHVLVYSHPHVQPGFASDF